MNLMSHKLRPGRIELAEFIALAGNTEGLPWKSFMGLGARKVDAGNGGLAAAGENTLLKSPGHTARENIQLEVRESGSRGGTFPPCWGQPVMPCSSASRCPSSRRLEVLRETNSRGPGFTRKARRNNYFY